MSRRPAGPAFIGAPGPGSEATMLPASRLRTIGTYSSGSHRWAVMAWITRTEPDVMADCCDGKTEALAALRTRRRGVLILALWINAVMFAVMFGAGIYAGSSALLADSLDNLGDAFVYAISLYVVYRSLRWRAAAALMKGLIQLAFGIGVLVYAWQVFTAGVAPMSGVMVLAASAALAANLACMLLLMRHRHDDINMRSAWLCSRNDLIGNVGVLLAAGGVYLTASHWPDVLVGVLIAAVFLKTAAGVLRDSVYALRHGEERVVRWG